MRATPGQPVVIVIEHSSELATVIARSLTAARFVVHRAGDAEGGLELVDRYGPDVVVLDLSLPGMDGLEACRRLRAFSDVYVLMLTGSGSEMDRILGFSAGADDYLTKPFYASELVARLRAMLRRPRTLARPESERVRHLGALLVDVGAHEARIDGETVVLSPTEFALLEILSSEPGVSFSRRQLIEGIWGPKWFGEDHVIDVHMSNLRRKLGDSPHEPRFVRTIRGFGYRIVGPC
jgi:DNA-binding response OmpR family regulator